MNPRLNKCSSIVSEIKAKRSGFKVKSRIVLFVGGGALSAVYSAGVLRALEVLGFTELFDVVVSLSAGTVNSAYFLAGQAYILPEIYMDLSSSQFVNVFRFSKIFDFDCAEDMLRRRLSIESMISNKTAFYAGATSISDGRGEFLNVKSNGLEWNTIKASAIPPLTFNSAITIGNCGYVDGEIGFPFPVKELVERFEPTHLLMVVNRPYDQHGPMMPLLEKLLMMTSLCIHAPRLWRNFFEWEDKSRSALAYAENVLSNSLHIGVLSPSQGISEACKDPQLLDDVMYSAFSDTKRLFE